MIELKNVNKYYKTDDEDIHVLNNINLTVNKGELMSIMGPSGSGKSTLINLIGFIDRTYEGEYLFEGRSLQKSDDQTLSKIRNESVGFVFQNFKLIENNTVYENVELPLLYGGAKPSETKERVMEVLDKVGIANKAQKFPAHLSGGQQQRVAIARALINRPKFIIADEPTGALDSVTSLEIMKLFQELNRNEGVTVIMVTHSAEVSAYCQRIVRILDGKIIEDKELIS